MLRFALPLLLALPLCVSATSQMQVTLHSQKWVLTASSYVPRTDAPRGVICSNIFGMVLGRARAKATSSANRASGAGFAWDTSLGCDVQAAAAATGLYNRTYRYIVGAGGPPTTPGGGGPTPTNPGTTTGSTGGEVEVWARCTAAGVANLNNADCAAAALGYSQFTSSLGTSIYAALQDSAAVTGSYSLGNLQAAYQGLGVGLNVNVGTGTGSYPDSDQNEVGQADCVNYYFVQHRSRAYIKVWANEGLIGLGASADCRMVAAVMSQSGV